MTFSPVQRLRPWLTYPTWGISLALIVLAPAFPAWAARVQYFPFALGLILLGLPHGAMDHLAIPHMRRRPVTGRYLLAFVGGYLGLTLAYLMFWRWKPSAALAVFLVVSCLHWGQGDYDYLRLFEGRPRPRHPLTRLAIWLVRGGLPIVLPVLAFPKTFARVAAGLTAWYGNVGLPAPNPQTILFGLLILLALGMFVLRSSWRDNGPSHRGAFWRDAGEMLLLGVLFWRVPPLLAVGTYFCVWHSARHIGRLMLADPVTSRLLSEGGLWPSLRRTAGQSLPLTLAALALLAGLYMMQRQHDLVSLHSLVFLYLSLIAALTVPHFLLVLWMDRQQRL